ncbi:hypothetical protein N781_10575 [Pontibacillus halophilus JSM 076056 = DSM 19796]|uniref:Prepilin-type N-terminal cleavage/methylation domain-containing protein n=1 Tax=Pontibacillus halophilus JSM 076056 = DSM 19796 TaxID=1385510 RepID=A0A0A5ICB5_9BACI|nr:prepilin-type N-terminal cleavage/methylation domain-containing protein [Pontibacillus halophilus]KGX93477.1 hypothetical protein N781_10575 [Pontibacillus halophilus JSM 076056 = DSM 19796]
MIKRMKQLLKDNKGFTLVELLAVIVILGIIAAIAIPAIGSIINNTEEEAHTSNALSILDAGRMAFAADLPDGGDDQYTITELVEGGFLEEAPVNPETDEVYDQGASFVTVTQDDDNGNVTYTVTLAGVDGMTDQSRADLTGSEDDNDTE